MLTSDDKIVDPLNNGDNKHDQQGFSEIISTDNEVQSSATNINGARVESNVRFTYTCIWVFDKNAFRFTIFVKNLESLKG